jgi:hypothetical protein
MSYQSLPRLSQMNIRMDYFAKQSRTLFSNQIQEHRVYIPLGSSFSNPYINQVPIYDQVKSKLYHAISIQSLQFYWEWKLSIVKFTVKPLHLLESHQFSIEKSLCQRVYCNWKEYATLATPLRKQLSILPSSTRRYLPYYNLYPPISN